MSEALWTEEAGFDRSAIMRRALGAYRYNELARKQYCPETRGVPLSFFLREAWKAAHYERSWFTAAARRPVLPPEQELDAALASLQAVLRYGHSYSQRVHIAAIERLDAANLAVEGREIAA